MAKTTQITVTISRKISDNVYGNMEAELSSTLHLSKEDKPDKVRRVTAKTLLAEMDVLETKLHKYLEEKRAALKD